MLEFLYHGELVKSRSLKVSRTSPGIEAKGADLGLWHIQMYGTPQCNPFLEFAESPKGTSGG